MKGLTEAARERLEAVAAQLEALRLEAASPAELAELIAIAARLEQLVPFAGPATTTPLEEWDLTEVDTTPIDGRHVQQVTDLSRRYDSQTTDLVALGKQLREARLDRPRRAPRRR